MLRQYAYAASGQVAAVIPAIFSLAVLTRLLGPASYGPYVVLMTSVALLTVAVAAGPQASALVLASRHRERSASLHGQSLVASVALLSLTSLVALTASPVIGSWLAPSVAPLLVGVNLIRLPAVVYAALVTSQLSGAGRVGTAALLGVVAALLSLLAPAAALLSRDHLAGAIIGTSAASFLAAVAAGVTAGRAFGLEWPRGLAEWRQATRIAVPMHIGTVAYWVMLRMDVIVVNGLLGPQQAGIYGLALGLSERVGMLTAPLYNATAWRISGEDRAVALRTLMIVARLEAAAGVVLALGTVVAGPAIVFILSGKDFAPAALPLAILVLGAAALPVWGAVGLYLVSHLDGAWATARLQVGVALASVLGYVILARVAGVVGAATASTLAYAALLTGGLILVRRSAGFSWRALLPDRAMAREVVLAARGWRSGATRSGREPKGLRSAGDPPHLESVSTDGAREGSGGRDPER